MSNTAPVENEHSPEASQQTSAVISSTLTKRPMGIFDSMYFANSGVTCSRIAVCAAAGVTQLTSTPICASSLPSALVNAIRPRFAAAHPAELGLPSACDDRSAAGNIELVHGDAKYNRSPSGISHMAGRLAGKTAFITAAAQGMGQAAALAFAREGARVWATDVNAQALKSIDGKEGIRTRVLDVTDEAAIARVAQEVGDIDVLFNCAGIVHNGSILEATVKDWDQAFAYNVRSMFLVTRAFLPGMLKKQNGSVIK